MSKTLPNADGSTRERATVDLTPAEIAQLNELIRRDDTPPRTARRASILLMSHQKYSSQTICTTLGIVRGSIYHCIRKYRELGAVGAVYDKERSGGPRRISDEAIEWMRSVAAQKPGHFGLENARWSVTALRSYIAQHAEEAGFPEAKGISRSRLWSLVFENNETIDRSKPVPITSVVSIYWLPVYLPLLLCADGRITFDKIEFPPINPAMTADLREGSEIICYIGVDPSSCRFFVRALRSVESKPFELFIGHLAEAVSPSAKIALYRCSSIQCPQEVMLQNLSRISFFEPFANDQVPKLCASLIMQTCRLKFPSLTAQSVSEMISRIENSLDGYCPIEG